MSTVTRSDAETGGGVTGSSTRSDRDVKGGATPSLTIRRLNAAAPGFSAALDALVSYEIGRASCRERVCQYV